ncbi:Methyltransferase-like protein 21D [Entomortierella chlamydospora]|uniref:Methyltransferase-like protein 21D n=1 Tax=Entomortierella chlamydospora TaxID=101097 RepID=A0A9P6SZ16_9FUNG|nr:Methyltransferase-like protein 21D [Entomortierella chlamydospora]
MCDEACTQGRTGQQQDQEEIRAGERIDLKDVFLSSREFEFNDYSIDPLEIEEDPTGLLKGGVGSTIWDAAIVLAKYLERSDLLQLTKSKSSASSTPINILELGSGTGIVGLVAARILSTKGYHGSKVVLTDKDNVVPLLQRNVENNASEGIDIESRILDWEAVSGIKAKVIKPATATEDDEEGSTKSIAPSTRLSADVITEELASLATNSTVVTLDSTSSISTTSIAATPITSTTSTSTAPTPTVPATPINADSVTPTNTAMISPTKTNSVIPTDTAPTTSAGTTPAATLANDPTSTASTTTANVQDLLAIEWDTVILSDCIWVPSLYESLIGTINTLIKPGSKTQLVIAFEKRNFSEEMEFFALLGNTFRFKDVKPEDQDPNYQSEDIYLFVCQRRT